MCLTLYFCIRSKSKILADQLKESVELVKELRVAIEKKHTCFDHECGKIEAVCNPKQSVLFLMWVTRNVELLSRVLLALSFKSSLPALLIFVCALRLSPILTALSHMFLW